MPTSYDFQSVLESYWSPQTCGDILLQRSNEYQSANTVVEEVTSGVGRTIVAEEEREIASHRKM